MTRASFPAGARLRRPDDFRAVFKSGRRHVRAGLVVIVAPGTATHARLGLAVAKRHVPRAVDRNRVKRVVRESFRQRRDKLGAADIVVLARKHTAAMSNRSLSGQLRDIWLEVVASTTCTAD